MKIEIVKNDSANCTINASIENSEIDGKIDRLANQAAKQMKIDGFRPGKAPVSVVKKRLGDRLKQDAEAEVIQDILNSGSKELGVDAKRVIGEPIISKFERGETSLDVELKIGLKPEIEINDIDDIVPKVMLPDVTKEEAKERIEELATASAPFESIKDDRGLEKGDLAVFDFEGFVDGEPFEGGKAEGFELRIGSGQFIPGFEDQMVGMKKGEEKIIEVTFPEDYQNKKLAGKKAEFKLKLHDIKAKKDVKIDDELAKKLLNDENGTLKKLEEEVIEQIKSEKLTKLYNEELKPKLIEALVEKFEFDLPEIVVSQEVELALRGKLQQMSKDELSKLNENKDMLNELRKELRADAIKSVKATFIVDALAKKEGIDVSDQEIIQTIYYEAMSLGKEPNQMLEYYKKQNLLPAIKMAMIEDRLLTKLLDDKNKKKEEKEES